MPEIKVNNRLIKEPIINIISKLKSELSNGLLREVIEKGDNIAVTCPNHKGGFEKNASCNIYNLSTNPKVERGHCYCFTCGYNVPLYKFIADCFNESEEFGKQWLINNFNISLLKEEIDLPEIDLHNKDYNNHYFLNPKVLNQYNYYHDYMWQRKLSKNIVDRFNIGYDPYRKALTFPVWDENDNLIMLTARSVNSKEFYIEKKKEKPVYLLNFAQKENFPFIIVCESQIDALYSWSLGYPAIAMIGGASPNQYKILNKCPIRNYVLMFDNDEGGRKANKNFHNHIRKDVFITDVQLPQGKKDINDLTPEEFQHILKQYQLI